MAGYDRDPDNPALVHHLAIAFHARAWDLELAGDPRAAQEWESALDFWRRLASSEPFWLRLAAQLQAADPNGTHDVLIESRRNLLEHLLDIHIDFIRHYVESEAPERAVTHIEIIRRARIPPALKKLLVSKVYDVIAAPVLQACASGDLDHALMALERFLDLFPDHLLALRAYCQTARQSVQRMSYLQDWDNIAVLSRRASPRCEGLSKHPDIRDDAAARAALEELASEFSWRGHDRGWQSLSICHVVAPLQQHLAEAQESFALCAAWCRLAITFRSSGSMLGDVFGHTVLGQVQLYRYELDSIAQSSGSPRHKQDAQLAILDTMVAVLEEVQGVTQLVELGKQIDDEIASIGADREQLRSERLMRGLS